MAATNKICVLGSPRTGSTLLRQLLDSQEGVVFAGEVFHPKNVQMHPALRKKLSEPEQSLMARDADPVGFLEKLAKVCPEPVFGLKVFPAHSVAVREHVMKDPSWRIVILYRANFLAVYASRLAARATGAFAADKVPGGVKPKVQFAADQFTHDWQAYERYYDKLITRCTNVGKRFLMIEYREVQRPELVRNLARQLSFPDETPFKTGLTKEGSNDILSRFSNAAEAEAAIAALGRSDWAREQGPLFLTERSAAGGKGTAKIKVKGKGKGKKDNKGKEQPEVEDEAA